MEVGKQFRGLGRWIIESLIPARNITVAAWFHTPICKSQADLWLPHYSFGGTSNTMASEDNDLDRCGGTGDLGIGRAAVRDPEPKVSTTGFPIFCL